MSSRNLPAGSWSSAIPATALPSLVPIGVASARVAKKKEKVEKKNKKPHRFRPGTRAKIEVRQQQRSMDMALPRAVFVRVVREIMNDISKERGEPYRISRIVFDALSESSERLVTQLFEAADLVRRSRKRETLMPSDIQTALRIAREMGAYNNVLRNVHH